MNTSNQADVEQLVARLEAAWNETDADAFAREFTENADFVNIRGEYGTGRDAIGAAHAMIWKTIYAGSKVRYSLTRLRQLTSDVLLAHLQADLHAPTGPLAGDTVGIPTMVLVRDGAAWRIAAFHNTLRHS